MATDYRERGKPVFMFGRWFWTWPRRRFDNHATRNALVPLSWWRRLLGIAPPRPRQELHRVRGLLLPPNAHLGLANGQSRRMKRLEREYSALSQEHRELCADHVTLERRCADLQARVDAQPAWLQVE